jgi:hypothetical protein
MSHGHGQNHKYLIITSGQSLVMRLLYSQEKIHLFDKTIGEEEE